MENPIITTIIPTYRRPRLLARALASVMNQTYPHLQILVFDNASGDETEEVVKKLIQKDHRIKYHRHSENIGMMANYQYSLTQVNTPFFSILSDDDLLLPWFYASILEGVRQFPDAGFFAASTIILSEDKKVIRTPLELWSKEGYFKQGEAVSEMIVRKYPVPTSVLFPRKVIEAIPIDVDNPLAWDCDFLVRIAMRFPIFTTKIPSAIFMHNSESFSNFQKPENWRTAFNRTLEKLKSSAEMPLTLKDRAVQLMEDDLDRMQSDSIFFHFVNKEFKKSYQEALSYKKRFGSSLKIYVMLTAAKTCAIIPLAFHLFLLMRTVRHAFRKKIENRYRKYLVIPPIT